MSDVHVWTWRAPGVTGPLWWRSAVQCPSDFGRIHSVRRFVRDSPRGPEVDVLDWMRLKRPTDIDVAEELMATAMLREAGLS